MREEEEGLLLLRLWRGEGEVLEVAATTTGGREVVLLLRLKSLRRPRREEELWEETNIWQREGALVPTHHNCMPFQDRRGGHECSNEEEGGEEATTEAEEAMKGLVGGNFQCWKGKVPIHAFLHSFLHSLIHTLNSEHELLLSAFENRSSGFYQATSTSLHKRLPVVQTPHAAQSWSQSLQS